MKALICTEPGTFEYTVRPDPESKTGHAIVRIRNIGICGTDLHAFEGTQPYFNYPRILGHELSGELVDVDEASGFQKGESVTFLPYLSCGNCVACKMGKTNCCENLQVCGVHIDGGMVDYYSIPTQFLVHSQGLGLNELAMVEHLSIGAHGIRRANVQANEYVLIMGAGPIGMGAAAFAGLRGAVVIVTDTRQQRLEFCRENLGNPFIINAGNSGLREMLLEITHGNMATVVIDASGNIGAINQGLQYVAHGGRYVLIGLQKENLIFSHPEFHKREATLMSSRNATREDFETVVKTIVEGKIRPDTVITKRVKFSEIATGFPEWVKPTSSEIKIMAENG
jgi:2-desacetyl-2-hydroxyethyl bacteriochlorophyllide A dehydrogenase